MREKIELFKVLSEPNRVRILILLLNRSLCVCEITSILDISTATVSNHLSILRKAGFLVDEKDGKWIRYSVPTNIKNPMVKEIIDCLPKWFIDEEIIKNDEMKVQKLNSSPSACNTLLVN
ncbi:MAG: ArsR/SmtB family transcription factor [Candidatus Kapaibacteriota bacterium]